MTAALCPICGEPVEGADAHAGCTPPDAADLPPAVTGLRWTPIRKEAVVRAVHLGDLSFAAVARLYGLSREEFDGWARRFRQHGRPGLSVMRCQELRA